MVGVQCQCVLVCCVLCARSETSPLSRSRLGQQVLPSITVACHRTVTTLAVESSNSVLLSLFHALGLCGRGGIRCALCSVTALTLERRQRAAVDHKQTLGPCALKIVEVACGAEQCAAHGWVPEVARLLDVRLQHVREVQGAGDLALPVSSSICAAFHTSSGAEVMLLPSSTFIIAARSVADERLEFLQWQKKVLTLSTKDAPRRKSVRGACTRSSVMSVSGVAEVLCDAMLCETRSSQSIGTYCAQQMIHQDRVCQGQPASPFPPQRRPSQYVGSVETRAVAPHPALVPFGRGGFMANA